MKLRVAKKVWRGSIRWTQYRGETWRTALHRLVKSDRRFFKGWGER